MSGVHKVLAFLCLLASFGSASAQLGWGVYGGDAGGQRFSASKQITPGNVSQLKQAWVYHTHALDTDGPGHGAAAFESTPILFRRTLFVTTPFDIVIALDARTGQEQWRFDPQIKIMGDGNLTTNRGVALWPIPAPDDGSAAPAAPSTQEPACSHRLFFGTLDARLLSIDAVTGRACTSFGDKGQVDLTQNVGRSPGEIYEVTSAPTVLGNVVVVGSSIPDNGRVKEIHGTVRGFDVHSGHLLWAFDPIATWADKQPAALRTGAANAWSTISADPALGLVYIPTGSASPDHWGGLRLGDGRDADSVVALDAKTGRRVWAFQVVHHNIWDYDVAAEPLLFTFRGKTPAVAIATKMGQIFVLDRRTGKPLFPVTERPVPQTDVPGEQTSPTQPFSSLPSMNPLNMDPGGPSFSRSAARVEDCRQQMAGKRYQGVFTPPSLGGSIQFPGPVGGVNWGGMAFDPVHAILYANNNSDAFEVTLIPRAELDRKQAYTPLFLSPPVIDLEYALNFRRNLLLVAVLCLVVGWVVSRKLWPGRAAVVLATIVLALIPLNLVLQAQTARAYKRRTMRALNASRSDDYSPQTGTPYWMHRKAIQDRDGNPCTELPWGALTALDLNTGKQVFRVMHGPATDGQQTGSVSVSGPIVTAGGLVFSGGSKGRFFYGYDAQTGKRLWQAPLSVPAQATPMSYELDGKQYVVIADGGHGIFGTIQGDSVVAYALPDAQAATLERPTLPVKP